MMTVEKINQIIKESKKSPKFKVKDICDGHHTFEELYNFRLMYNALLFNEWARDSYRIYTQTNGDGSRITVESNPILDGWKYDVHKSWKHHDGELCFGGNYFIVVAILPTGQITNHYKRGHWDLFQIPEYEKAKYPYDGHTSNDVLERMKGII